ncbi:MAG TPA: hypothetical protein VNQ73_02125 [Ilumatobacter sp.]|nr:hypothetical protein [Ilumatobacter sp.]
MNRGIVLAAAFAAALTGCSGDAASPVEVVSTGSTTEVSATEVVSAGLTTEVAVTTGSTAAVPVPVTSPTTPTTDVSAGWCAVAADLHALTAAFRRLDTGQTAAVQMSLVAILERLAAIAPVAPADLTDDLAVSAEAFELLDAALATVGYDITAADLTEVDARTAEIAAANDRIRAYNAAECGIDIGVTGEDVP